MGIERHAPIAGFEGDLPITPSADRCLIDAVRFYNKLLKLDDSRLVRKIYKLSRRSQSKSWANSLKYWLQEYGFELEWAEQRPIDLKLLTE